MIKVILFDLDNTLIDFMKFKTICCEEAIDAMIDGGLNMKKETALKRLFKLYYKEGLEDDTIFQKFLRQECGKVDYRILAYGITAYRKVRAGFLRPYPKTKQTLIKLKEKNLKLGILTDAPKLKAWIRLSNMQLDDFFDEVIAKEDTGKLKPDKKPFLVAMKRFKVKPEECLMVGDRPKRDIAGAKSLKMHTCFAQYGYGKKVNSGANFTIDKIEELLPVVNKLTK